MVRLKDGSTRQREVTPQGFNSTMVRLKVIRGAGFEPQPPGFNSTMVRLKGIQSNPAFEGSFEFQFHNGSIKRKPTATN